jgi:hypothetical protein
MTDKKVSELWQETLYFFPHYRYGEDVGHFNFAAGQEDILVPSQYVNFDSFNLDNDDSYELCQSCFHS